MKLHERIKYRREELKMSQEELAKELGYKSKSTISKIESGENDITQSKIIDFAKVLKTTPLWLMGLVQQEEQKKPDLKELLQDNILFDGIPVKAEDKKILENFLTRLYEKLENEKN